MLVINDQKYIKSGDCSADIVGDWVRVDVADTLAFDCVLALDPGGSVQFSIETSPRENKSAIALVYGVTSAFTDAHNGRQLFYSPSSINNGLWLRLKVHAVSGTGRIDAVALGHS